MRFHSLLFVNKINQEYLSLPFVSKVYNIIFYVCFLSTSETNQYL